MVLTGNDLAIDMVMWGSDYLLGLSTFAPAEFALRDRMWFAGDPAFYDLKAILDVQNAAAPLARAADFTKEQMFACPGADQAVLFRYFRTIGYDYTHPDIGQAWNSCAGVTDITRDGGKWVGRTRGLTPDHEVHLVHYWSQFKPWAIGCPIYAGEPRP